MVDEETSTKRVVRKAFVVNVAVPESTADPAAKEIESAWGNAGAVAPRYPIDDLCARYETSDLLRPNIDSYEVNIDLAGWHLKPTFDFEDPSAKDRVWLMLQMEAKSEGRVVSASAEDVKARLETMRGEAQIEEAQLNRFFRNCGGKISFERLRSETRRELEVTGNAYWEVVRDDRNEICLLERVDVTTMRVRALQKTRVNVLVPVATSECRVELLPTKRRFRSYVQLTGGAETTYFKELGDPRIMSSKTGKYYRSTAALREAEGVVRVATEILHWSIFLPGSPTYGVPRWIGAAPAVSGARASEEVSSVFWDENAIPKGILAMQGGEWDEEDERTITNYLSENHKGRKNQGKLLVLCVPAPAVTASGGTLGAMPKLEFIPLEGALQKDGQVDKYEASCELRVGQQFRQPKMFRGDSSDQNRSTSETAKDLVNEQVFAPERAKFDDVINSQILSLLRIRFWKFASGVIKKADPTQLWEIVDRATELGVITLNEARQDYFALMGKKYTPHKEEWGDNIYPLLTKQSAGEAVRELAGLRDEVGREAGAARGARTNRTRERVAAGKDPEREDDEEEDDKS